MTKEELERNIEKWREITRPFIDKRDKLNSKKSPRWYNINGFKLIEEE